MSDFTVEKYDWNLKSHRAMYTDSCTYPNALKSPESRHSWACGDSKNRRKLTNKFVQTSGLHGVKYLCPRRKITWIFKLLLRILFVVCFLLMIGNLNFLVQESFVEESTYMTSVKKNIKAGEEADPDYFPTYPAITVCRKPPYKTDFNRSYMGLVEYAFLSLGFPMVSFTPKEISMVSEMAMFVNDTSELNNATLAFMDHLITLESRFQNMKSKPLFNLTHFIIEHSINCSEFFSRCLAMVHPLNCCAIFQPVLTSFGLCYTMKDSHILKELSIDSPIERPFIMDLLSPPHPGKGVEEGFSVFLTDPLYSVSSFQEDERQKIVSGYSTTISVQLVKKQRTALHTAWHGLSNNCPVMPGDSRTERFTSTMCDQFVTANVLKRTCNCTSLVTLGKSSHLQCSL
ncbi:hypothetical protein AVEN_50429-1 [Araneus ventricosus]|uniref:Sodium channel protein Nach n=1 Tax=Araneus ventricosus TaxID=182803 RepID=A0A4Y2EQY1_ARAVE|nr:hypothetical protein AVEN_50429-1 [Araneus ventricosus]